MVSTRMGRVCYIQMANASMEFDMQDHIVNKYSLDSYERWYARVSTFKGCVVRWFTHIVTTKSFFGCSHMKEREAFLL